MFHTRWIHSIWMQIREIPVSQKIWIITPIEMTERGSHFDKSPQSLLRSPDNFIDAQPLYSWYAREQIIRNMYRMGSQCQLDLTEWCKQRSLTPKRLIDRARVLRDQNNCDRSMLGPALMTLMRAENSLSTHKTKEKKKKKRKRSMTYHRIQLR